MDKRPIGIFDSGIGGLTVFSEMRKQLKNEDLVYLGDTANFPYGPKSKEEIIEFTKRNIEFLIKQDCKFIVIACGTATSHALEIVQNKYSVPIIGIIEPTVDKILEEDNKVIGIMATVGTIKSDSWGRAIKNKNPKINVINGACPLLAEMAEEDFNIEEVRQALKEYLEPFKGKEVDRLILGCTHYPIFKELIQEELREEVAVISTSEIVSDYIKEILKIKESNNDEDNTGDYKIYLSSSESNFINIAKRIFEIQEEKVYFI